MKVSFTLALLCLVTVFSAVEPHPTPTYEQSVEITKVSERSGIQNDFPTKPEQTTVGVREIIRTMNKPTDSFVEEEETPDLTGFAHWLVDKDDSNAKSFRGLLTQAWNIMKDAPWNENDQTTVASTDENYDNQFVMWEADKNEYGLDTKSHNENDDEDANLMREMYDMQLKEDHVDDDI